MKTIPLTRGLIAIVDDQDYQRLSHFKWRAKWDGISFYAAYEDNKTHKLSFMHRLILYAPRGMEVDHIDGNTMDNRRSNLRLTTHAQNGRNRKTDRTNTSGFKGVSFEKGKRRWNAYITFRGKKHNLGYFDTPEFAAQEYNRAARLLFGKFARLNVISWR